MRFLGALAILGGCLAAGAFACGSSSNGSNNSPVTEDGGSDSGTVESGGPMDAGSETAMDAAPAPYPAFVPTDMPQVQNFGGPVMKTPKVVPIFYAEDNPATVATIKDYLSKLPTSHWWAGWTQEYGIGALTIEDAVVLPDLLPRTWDDANIQADLAARLQATDGGPGQLPEPDANTIYAYFFPPGVTLTGTGTPTDAGAPEGGLMDDGGVSCDVGGWHGDILVGPNNTDVAYAVVPRCDNFGDVIFGLDAVTAPFSHELAESSTDPFPNGNPAYAQIDDSHLYWSKLVTSGEVGDMCEINASPGGSFVKYPDMPYMVQRIWSNKAAKAGTDPCVPTLTGSVYYQSYPIATDMISYTTYGATAMSLGVDLPTVGSSKTIELDLASTAPTSGPWTVAPFDTSASGDTYLHFAFSECGGASTCTGTNGTKLHLEITLAQAGRRGYETFIVQSGYRSDGGGPMAGNYDMWLGLAGGQAADGGGGSPRDAGGGG